MIRRSFLALGALAIPFLPKSPARTERKVAGVSRYDFRNGASLLVVTHRPNVRIHVHPPCVATNHYAVVTICLDGGHHALPLTALLSLDGKQFYHVTSGNPGDLKSKHETDDFTLIAGQKEAVLRTAPAGTYTIVQNDDPFYTLTRLTVAN